MTATIKRKDRPVNVSKGYRPTAEAQPAPPVNRCNFPMIERMIADGASWSALTVTPGCEFKVVDQMLRSARPVFVAAPIRTEWRYWTRYDDEKSPRDFAALPGYILTATRSENEWQRVRDAPNVTGFVPDMSGRPARLSPKNVRAFTYHMSTTAPEIEKYMVAHRAFDEGDEVRITDPQSPFYEMVVKALSIAGGRAKVLLDLFNGQHMAELPTGSLEKVAS